MKILKSLLLIISLSFGPQIRFAQADTIVIKTTKSSNVALKKALLDGATEVYFPEGVYEFDAGVIISASNLRITGEGTIVATQQIPRLLEISGDNNEVSLNIDGRGLIENAIRMRGNNLRVSGATIKNLHGFGKNSAIAISLITNGKFNVSNNIISGVYASGDGKYGNGIGMARGIAVTRTNRGAAGEGVIQKNEIRNVWGEEGDSITLANSLGKGVFGNINVSITDNLIHNYSRRAIKIQGSEVSVSNNRISNKAVPSVQYSCSSAISIYLPRDIQITDNKVNVEKCGVLNVYMNKDNPNLADTSNLQIINNQFETSADNDVPLINLSVANSYLKGVKIIGNKGIGNSKGISVSKVKDLEVYNNDIQLRQLGESKSNHIRIKQLAPEVIQKNNSLR